MKFLHSMTVGRRLAAAFALLIALLAGSTALALSQFKTVQHQVAIIVEVNNRKAALLSQMRESNMLGERYIRDFMLATPQQRPAVDAQLKANREHYAQLWAALKQLPANSEGMRARQAIEDSLTAARATNNRLLGLVREGDLEGAKQLLSGQAQPLLERRSRAIAAAVELQNQQNAAGAATILGSVALANRALIAFGLLAAGLAAALAWLISRSLVRPLKQATQVADAIAHGDLDNPIGPQPGDEPGQLLTSMRGMQEQLKAVAAAQQEMARQHDSGKISFRMDQDAFPGQYGSMVRDTNALVDAHIAVKLKLAQIMSRYAIGDLSQDMDRLPGEEAVLSETMDTVKSNLTAMNSAIKLLAQAAADGDFSVRGDTARFQHDFLAMVESLNRLMATADGNLGALSKVLQAIAAGDLTQRMQGEFNGVFAQMRDDANATTEQLSSIVGRIQHATVSINTAASEIAAGNNDLSQRTEQQAANLEETAASMEELTSTVRQNAEGARQANQLAIGAAAVASQGGDVVGKVVATMGDIEVSSKKIADIISVIDGIAFQTNILALNAAVEAARAGDQGRGFAVVASEVRTLAQRSAGAAKEIKQLIDDSVGKVAEGSVLVDQAGKTMADIVASVQRVTDIMGEISAASQEQSAGIEQVNLTVTQMDEATQQNAALVEEATAAARAMEEQAGQLSDAVSIFKVQQVAAVATAAKRPAPLRLAAATSASAAKRVTGSAIAKPKANLTTAQRPVVAAAGNSESNWQEF
ncbi:methyl-accepting chemotaxis protein [Xanthomonas phaseoli]|uniref:methyl-accepting chemotaxis protein n=1 Tax=Xanthomonas phaseoli TaxID=1985254 RepID=UPI001E5A1E13|nr:methyl-accepting chemotaxis protein [Xanthomonas phaseoli]MCC8470451.1 methyl-accepting chemotaxis protein [Xanthomonas phaseoli]